jgi:hypothetical protein
MSIVFTISACREDALAGTVLTIAVAPVLYTMFFRVKLTG